MTYDKNRDAITILDRAAIHVAPDEHGAGAADVTCATATFARREKSIAFEQNVRVVRGQQTTEAADAVAHLSADESRIETVELHGGARIGEASPAPGALRMVAG